MSPSISITRDDIKELCELFKQNAYSVCYETPEAAEALARCKALLELDYKVVEVNNTDGALCSHYPSKILICQSEISSSGNEVKNEALNLETEADVNQLRSQILKARKGRCRARFPIPVIFYNGKNICRSGTTAHFVEILGRATVETLNSYVVGSSEDDLEERGDENEFNDDQNLNLESSVRKNDIQLLKMYDVKSIFDLMVEQRKVKYGVYVTSSESADEENRYSDFKIFHIPYPGCEFFSNMHHSEQDIQNVHFDWNQKMCDKIFDIPNLEHYSDMMVNWEDYKTWDIMELTKNYLMLILKEVHESNSGILVHCISGWDRTPLFISLIRISLWADGLIHKSLNALQLLYLTIAYDWMLFGHNLKNRLEKYEEIFFFCFSVLKRLGTFELSKDGLLIDYDDARGDSLHAHKRPIARYRSPIDNSIHLRDCATDCNDLSDSDPELKDTFEELPSSSSSNESNGNNPGDPSSDSNGGGASSVNSFIPKKSSPVPIKKKNSTSDTDTSGSWAYVTSTGSLTNREELASLKKARCASKRSRRLNRVRIEFYKVYFNCVPLPYRMGPSVFEQVLGNFSEKVGLT